MTSSRNSEEPPEKEAVLRLTVENVSSLEEVAFSKPVTLRNHTWRLMVVHREVKSHGDGTNRDVMGAYIQHIGPKPPTGQPWSIVVSATIKLVNQFDTKRGFSKDFRHQYTQHSTDWGYSTFLRWKEVTNLAKGFVKDGAIVVQARMNYPDIDTHETVPTSQSHITPSLLPTSQSLVTSSPSPSTPSHQQLHSLSQSLSQSQNPDYDSSQLVPASTPSLPSEVASLLVCSCCKEHYKSEGRRAPYNLTCGHTFCLDCLLKASSHSDTDRIDLSCSLCSQQTSGTTDHPPWFPNHSLCQLLTLSRTRQVCSVHHHDLNYYCFEDKCLVCIYCAYHGEHSAHQCRHISEAKQMVWEGMRMVRLQATTRACEGERGLRLLRDEREGVRSRAQAASRMVEDYFAGIETAIRRQKEMLQLDLQKHTAEVLENMDLRIRDLDKIQENYESIMTDYKKWKQLPAGEALQKVATVTERLQSIVTLPKHTLHPPHPTLSVSVDLPCSSFLSSIRQMGCVRITPLSSSSSSSSIAAVATTERDNNTSPEEEEEQTEGRSSQLEGGHPVISEVNEEDGQGEREEEHDDLLNVEQQRRRQEEEGEEPDAKRFKTEIES